MHYPHFSHVCKLLLVGSLTLETLASQDANNVHRLLRAATKRSDLYRRNSRITKKFESEVAYVEKENTWSSESIFVSQVKVNSQSRPIFNLEEHEHHLQDVECGDGTMKLHFVDLSSARDAMFACNDAAGGIVITSHESCNEEGERSVYSVHDVSFSNDGVSLELTVLEASWQDAFDHFDISFGHTSDNHLYRRHSDFVNVRRKRQNTKIDIPSETPDNINTITFDLASELLNTTFAAPSFLAGLEALVPIPAVPIEIGCKRCTTRGQLALSQGAINIDVTQIDLIPDVFQGGDDGRDITSVITSGFIELVATGVGAHLDMFARPKASGAFEVALFAAPILGFVIPGVGKAGAVFEPRIAVDFEVSGGLEVNYGIDVTVPDSSNIRIELTNIASSAVNGFPGSTLSPLPFSVNVTDVDVLLGLAFKPSVPISFEFTGKLEAGITVAMNLPRLDALLSTNAAKNCGNNSNTTFTGAPYANKTQDVPSGLGSLGPLVLVEANISVTVDVALNLTLPLLPPPFEGIEAGVNLFSVVVPIVTSCVAPENAFKTVTAILPPPISANHTLLIGTTSIITTPCNVTSTIHITKTPIHTSAIRSPSTHIVSTSQVPPSGYPVKEAPKPTHQVDITSSHIWAPSSTLTPATESSIINVPVSTTPPVILETPSVVTTSTSSQVQIVFNPPVASDSPAPSSGPIVSIATGFLSPSNASTTVIQQTNAVIQFTGAAVPSTDMLQMAGARLCWQLSVVGVGIFLGSAML